MEHFSQQAAIQFPLPASHRKTSLGAGLFYILTFVSIPTLALYASAHDPDIAMGPVQQRDITIGGLLEIVVALSGIVTAIVLYPILRLQSKSLALGLVASRIVEAGTMFAGAAFIMTAAMVKEAGSRQLLVTLYDRIFLLGQGFMPAINDLLLGILLYRSRLVPRTLAMIGILGAFPLIAGYLAVLFGWMEQRSAIAGLSAVMVAVFEFSLGLYLVFKGFRVNKHWTE